MISGEKFLHTGLVEKYIHLMNSFKNNDFENILRKLKDYLLEAYPIREKKGILYEDNKCFLALKKVYNLFKHKCDIDLLINTHILICNKSYPHHYPYRYGDSGIRFGDFTNVFNSAKYDKGKGEKKEKDIELCNEILKDKEVKDLIPDLHNATIQLFNL